MRTQIAIAQIKFEYGAWNFKVTDVYPFRSGTAYLLDPTLAEGQEPPTIGGIPFVVEEEGRARIVPQLSAEWFDILHANSSVKDISSRRDA